MPASAFGPQEPVGQPARQTSQIGTGPNPVWFLSASFGNQLRSTGKACRGQTIRRRIAKTHMLAPTGPGNERYDFYSTIDIHEI